MVTVVGCDKANIPKAVKCLDYVEEIKNCDLQKDKEVAIHLHAENDNLFQKPLTRRERRAKQRA